MAKRKPKNKQELNPNPKKPVFKQLVQFEFEVNGAKYKNNNGRLKISTEGGISLYIKTDNKWQAVKGQLTKLKMIQKRVVGYMKRNVSKKKKKVTQGSSTSLPTK